MNRKIQKIRLSLLVKEAEKMFLGLMGLILFVLGSFYLFMLNRVTMSGYVLTKETQSQQQLLQEIQRLESVIAQKESREFISESSIAKELIPRDGIRYVTISPVVTAQK